MSHSPRGFSLVELLVVVSVIAVLLLVMAPTVSQMIETARRTGCENNHHQTVNALASFTADNKTQLCYPNWAGAESAAGFGPGWLYWYNQRLTGGFVPGDREKGVFYQYHRNHDVFRCPMDYQPWNIGPTHAITSYLMNGASISYGRTAVPFRVMDFESTDIMFWEAHEAPPYPPFNDGSSYPGEGLTKRHKDGATFGCVDGSATYLTRAEFDALTYTSSRTRLWCSPTAFGVTNGH